MIYGHDMEPYKIIIPKEEPKPIHQQIIDVIGGEDRFREIAKIKPKQETLEEFEIAALKYNEQFIGGQESRYAAEDFINGAKWQQEQFKNESTAHYIDRHIVEAMVEVAKQKMYSEEETEELIIEAIKRTAQYCNINKLYGDTIEQFSKEWFNENKKK